jgi:uncharacterized membrane protein YkoI
MARFTLLSVVAALVLQPILSTGNAQEVAVAAKERTTAARGAQQKSILDVVKSLEEADYAPITEISLDDGVWEVEAYKEDIAYELSIDPETGEVISEHRDNGDPKPPAKSMLLSTIIEAIEKAGYTHVHDVSFEHRVWEAEVRRDNMKRELRLDPLTGEIVEDRVDD